MKRNSLTILVGVLLLVVFGLLLFTFQVRQTEIALVTTFDKPSRYITEPGFNWKWPPPIQQVFKFDKRIQTLDYDKIEETMTKDGFTMIVQVYLTWTINKPDVFFSSFPSGTVAAAEPSLEELIRSAKTVIGDHPFSDFVSTDPKQLKLVEVEKEILAKIQPAAMKYGVEVHSLGIKKLGLPESVTQKVFDRMTKERQSKQAEIEARGQNEAAKIKTDADVKRKTIVSGAEAQATIIRGEADAEAFKSYAVFNQNPELAKFFWKLRALEDISKERTSLILDGRTTPLDLLTTNFWQQISTNRGTTLPTNAAATNAMATTLESPENGGK